MSKLLRFLSRISIRLLAFNILVVFVPVFGILSLETYELHLLDQQERSMVQQGRLLAAALGESGPLRAEDAERILVNLQQRVEARLRVLDRESRLLADSSRLGPRRESDEPPPVPQVETRESRLYRLGSILYRFYERIFLPPEPPLQDSDLLANGQKLEGDEIQLALEGRYGGAIRRSPATRSLTLYSAIPIRSGAEVVGVALVSKSTFPILRALYDLRLQTFKVVLTSVGVAMVLSLLVSTTIARPLKRLRHESQALLDRRGRLRGRFKELRRRDEIGDLSRALHELTRRLEGHLAFIESFASDVSHEFKNPLASIRNATELLAEVDDPADRERFECMVLRDVARLENLLSGVREISQIDALIEEQPREEVALDRVLAGVVEQVRMGHPGVELELATPEPSAIVHVVPDRLAQVFENLLANAVSFSPSGGVVRVELGRQNDQAVVRIADQGPGIPEEHLAQIFKRFFSYRPAGSSGDGHTGLGLSIARSIVEASGGRLTARNAPDGGAVFEVVLPMVGSQE